MLLAYVDESGTSYQKNGSIFKDGPFSIYSAVLVPENKYFHLERLFYDAVKKLLGIKDWRKFELHATDIWNRSGRFSKLSETQVREYFEELFQIIAKLHINVAVGVQQKQFKRRSSKLQSDEVKTSAFVLLHMLDHCLSKIDQTAIIVADKSDDNGEQLIQDLLYQKTKWRYNPGARKQIKGRSKFYFESCSCFLLDQIHYVDSRDSLFVQLSDHIVFVLNRVFTYLYLKYFHKEGFTADINKVPISPGTFNFFSEDNLKCAFYDKKIKDIAFVKYNESNDFGDFYFINNFSEYK